MKCFHELACCPVGCAHRKPCVVEGPHEDHETELMAFEIPAYDFVDPGSPDQPPACVAVVFRWHRGD